jgi:hypothetical protein
MGRVNIGGDMPTSVEITERAAIGDELRRPIAWCEMDSCIQYFAHPAALGEADIRARAIAAEWRVDALGRLACPRCQQSGPWFWTTHPIVLWDRDRAFAMATLLAAAAQEDATGSAGDGAETGVIPAVEPALVPLPAQGRHRERHGQSGRAR